MVTGTTVGHPERVRTVVLGERPPELTAWLERRRALGLDGHDEVWEGVDHVAPHASTAHGIVASELVTCLAPFARARDLVSSAAFNLGEPDDFRVPDAGYFREMPSGVYATTAAVVVEVLSPDDETFAKLDFYRAHGVAEVIVADPATRTVRCLSLAEGAQDTEVSRELGVAMRDLAASIDWPPTG